MRRLPAVICHREILGGGREGGPAMREKRGSAAACCFSGVADGRRRGEEVEREVTGWVCCRKLWRYGCGVLVGSGEGREKGLTGGWFRRVLRPKKWGEAVEREVTSVDVFAGGRRG
ncbi:hypothetical protein HAX54_040314 [Datura stramonium]|uniref:Uncharacterized protein n=1 Tax=Datura stramonium TaxID=4076 RepID=A0ABS8VMI9_DATST|nr:hypothetical protein [Datura stramonium]